MTEEREVDWDHPPPATESPTPSCFHDGLLERLEVDARARTVALWVDVEYLRAFGGLPDDVRFGVEIAGVTAMRATSLRPHPDPIAQRSGEPNAEWSARIDAWRALAQEVSLDWDTTAHAIAAHGMDVTEGSALSAAGGCALRLSGHLQAEEADGSLPWITMTIAGASLRWTRSDGAAWSAEDLEALSDGYWDDWAERGRRRQESRRYPHVTRYSSEYLRHGHLDVAFLRRTLDELAALPETMIAAGIDPAELANLSDELVYARDQPEWREVHDRIVAELRRRASDDAVD